MPPDREPTRAFVGTDPRLKLGTDPRARVAPVPLERKLPGLSMIQGPAIGRCFPLFSNRNPYVVGRNRRADIHIDDRTVSREHAHLSVIGSDAQGPVVMIRDLGGRNGTLVNGHPVYEVVLKPGDKIQIGDVILRFDHLDPLDLKYQEALAERIGAADVDPRTGLYTKRFYLRELPKRVDEWTAIRVGYAMIVIDIDRFKEVNDSLGHDAGDRVLEAVGRIVQGEVRRGDIGVRYGGDELVLILPGADVSESRIVASRIRIAVRTDPIGTGQTAPKVTVSQGIAVHNDGDSLSSVFERADSALLRAKSGGRDRIEVAEHDSDKSPTESRP